MAQNNANLEDVKIIDQLLDHATYKDLNQSFPITLEGGSEPAITQDITVQGIIGFIGMFLHILAHHADKVDN